MGRLLLDCSLLVLFFLSGTSRSIAEASRPTISAGETRDRPTNKEKNRMSLLRFGGSIKCTTEPLPCPRGKKSMSDFFSSEKFRKKLFNGSIEKLGEPSPEQLRKWSDEALRMGAATPSKKDQVIRLEIRGIPFPGIKIIPISIIGTKLILPSLVKRRVSPYAEHQFVEIGSELKAEGPKPLVNLFYRMIGSNQEDNTEEGGSCNASSSTSTHLFSRISAEPANNGKGDITFINHAKLEIEVEFPSLLLRLTPISTERIEKMNSRILQKAIEKDAPEGLERFRKEYMKWVAE